MAEFWATGAVLGMAMLSYNLMSLFRQAVMNPVSILRWRRYTTR